ncbi:MAG: hypothetical protein R2857_10720 [Vampirovibrionales bacterium]
MPWPLTLTYSARKAKLAGQVFLNYNDQTSRCLSSSRPSANRPDVSKDIACGPAALWPAEHHRPLLPRVGLKSLPFALALINVDKDSLMIGPENRGGNGHGNRQLPATNNCRASRSTAS